MSAAAVLATVLYLAGFSVAVMVEADGAGPVRIWRAGWRRILRSVAVVLGWPAIAFATVAVEIWRRGRS